jgi:hypothetical protein
MRFALLADCPDAIPKIASWYFDQWGHLRPETRLKDIESKLQGSLNNDEIPILNKTALIRIAPVTLSSRPYPSHFAATRL